MNALLLKSLWETIYMVALSTVIATAAGIPLGVILVCTDRGGILQNLGINRVLGWIVNATRSTPFIILMVAIIPLTRMIVGTSIGTAAAMVPLCIAAAPFIARLVETSLKEVDGGVIEAAQSMGATPWQIITKVMIPEAMPSIISGITITIINLIGCSAMAGAVGGGGLGDLAIRYGYQRFQADVMIITVVILIIMVQVVQSVGDYASRRLNKRNL
ncbi:MAG: ABC transporter permease [Selenomonadales bacterium]|jgi:D-methionine transport system permease protein|nr:ABC transporter permease [Selenomonadales bacterium]MBQ2114958.1 ABC transporter permease [Selenomonadales bacterium]MBQ2246577.1 ABC transporter permease [Selenomonadales bacterium]MBQ5636425.1 ABC transporter permease [Selenomonadales bacterium]MBQ5745856.1 ABC transporter permease [Selenomonadales bacterium]